MRTIIHSDMNNFYASVECFLNPKLREEAVAVVGDIEKRKGIVLAKNMLAKRMGVKTGEQVWVAKQKCPCLITVKANFSNYIRFSKMARKIYGDYSDRVEPFGLDEAWIDVTASRMSGKEIANDIRRRMKEELGLTASVGVSFNKIFAKLGSDMKKPDATTIITPENFKQKVWELPAEELLYVGRATRRKLERRSIMTIGDIANADPNYLSSFLGKWGYTLYQFANGLDASPVKRIDEADEIKSVGNSTTTPRDLTELTDIKMVLYTLSESVAERLRALHKKCTTVKIFIRDTELHAIERQKKVYPTFLSKDIAQAALELFEKNCKDIAVRALGITAAELIPDKEAMISLFQEEISEEENLECAIDLIRRRYGQKAVFRSVMLMDSDIAKLNPIEDHIIHPVSFFG